MDKFLYSLKKKLVIILFLVNLWLIQYQLSSKITSTIPALIPMVSSQKLGIQTEFQIRPFRYLEKS